MENIEIIIQPEITNLVIEVQEQAPGGGNDKNYTHTQTTASDVWNIAHNLNKKPSVTVIDSSGSLIFGDLIYNDNNSLTIDFNSVEVTGTAILN